MLKDIKRIFKEIKDPLIDFFNIRTPGEKVCFYGFPIAIGLLYIASHHFLIASVVYSYRDFLNDLIGQLITMLSLFISFSMAYLSMIITSSGESIERIRGEDSEKYTLKNTKNSNKEKVTLYQVLISEITYNLLFEVMFLVFVFFQKFLMLVASDGIIRLCVTVNVTFLMHVLIVMMVTVKNIYFTFWKSD